MARFTLLAAVALFLMIVTRSRAQTAQPADVPTPREAQAQPAAPPTGVPGGLPPLAPPTPPAVSSPPEPRPATPAGNPPQRTAQSAQPATRPGNRSAEDMLRQMLQPQGQAAQPLKPIPDLPPDTDATGGANAVAPDATTQPVMREGTLLLDRVGRLTPSADGKSSQLTLEADGILLSDPPLILLPNRRLMQLEDQVQATSSDPRVRVSGEITEYRGRNYLLLQRWTVIPDAVKPLQ